MDLSVFVNEANATTQKLIAPATVRDFWFRSSSVLAKMRAQGKDGIEPWVGGLYKEMPFAYRPMIGGAYPRGGTFNTMKVETTSANRFFPRFYYVNLTQYLSDLLVFNTGPTAIIDRMALDQQMGVNTMNELIIIAMLRHGQGIAGGASGNTDNREIETNGLAEAYNDGITPGWDGNVFPVYGNSDRLTTGRFGNSLNSIPRWCGDSAGNVGALTYFMLEEGYQECSLGNDEPDLGICNKGVYAYIKNRIQPQQRFMDNTMEYTWGVSGIRFNNAVIVKDDYFPSARYGEYRPTGSYKTGTFVVPSGFDAKSNLPVATTTCTVGGTFLWHNSKKWKGTMPNNLYGFGFTGYQRPINSDVISGQYMLAFTAYSTDSRKGKWYYGIRETA